MNKLKLLSIDPLYNHVSEYIYETFSHHISEFTYIEDIPIKRYYWKSSLTENDETNIKFIHPHTCKFSDIYKNHSIHITINYIESPKLFKMFTTNDFGNGKDILLKELIIQMDDKENIIKFVDDSKEYFKKKTEENKKKTKETVRVFYYKEFWSLLSKNPKRSFDTVYLKENQKEKIINDLRIFLDEDTRKDYLYYGIPYKCVYMLYGPPGTGKTCTINAIASYFDCDIYIIPITKELKDIQLIDALSYFSEKEDKKKIIIIEDIDCIFTNRKEGDENNQITLQNLLNCFDGFTCVEGTILFITANKPEILDDALLRSCRIDHKLEFGNADKYQTKQMFMKYFPDKIGDFEKFYQKISHKKYTIAMLQEFMFYNRNKNIFTQTQLLFDIIDKNDPKKLGTIDNKNIYM